MVQLIKTVHDLPQLSHFEEDYVWFGDVYNNLYPHNVLTNMDPLEHKTLDDQKHKNPIEQVQVHQQIDIDVPKISGYSNHYKKTKMDYRILCQKTFNKIIH